ncbi:MAG: PilZ domain-containing protein [Erythrobacter sp.]|jgi:hypothetical protein|nr:PilZ domain-containing protein [Erythrobacter sp.]
MPKRSSRRVSTRATGSSRASSGLEWQGEIDDLSLGGCRITDLHGRLNMGELLSLFIAGTGPHQATVAWRHGTQVGVKFLKPLSARLFRLLEHEEWERARAVDEEPDHRRQVRRI